MLFTMVMLLLVPVLIALNAFFVSAEYAIVTIRISKIEELRQRGVRSAQVLARLKADMGGALATIQICITATNLMIGAAGESAVTPVIARILAPLGLLLPRYVAGPMAAILGFAFMTFFTVILGELLPKALTLQFTEWIALRVARPIDLLRGALAPIVRLMNGFANGITKVVGLGSLRLDEPAPSEAELEIMVDRADEAGEFHEAHGELLRRAFDFVDLTVLHVMIPMQVAGIMDSNATVDDLAAQLGDKPFTRWPLRDPATGRINGVVNVKMALYARALAAQDVVILHDLASMPVRVSPDMPLVEALRYLRDRRAHLAVVEDKAARELGVIVMEDILAAIVGKIPSEARIVRPRTRSSS